MKGIAKIALKLMAIYIFIDFVNESYRQVFWMVNSTLEIGNYIIFGTISALLIKLIISIVLWFKADVISNSIITDDNNPAFKLDDYKKLQLVAFSVIGIILLSITIPNLFRHLFEYLSYPNRPLFNYLPELIAEILKMIIGGWLLYDSRNLANRIQPN